jgi:hypothetical protein
MANGGVVKLFTRRACNDSGKGVLLSAEINNGEYGGRVLLLKMFSGTEIYIVSGESSNRSEDVTDLEEKKMRSAANGGRV